MFTTKRARVQASPTCSFCGKDKEDATVLVEHSPSARICDGCLALTLEILEETRCRQASSPTPPHVAEPGSARRSNQLGGRRDAPQCSFCDKTENEVLKLIAGPDVCICNECIDRYESHLRDAVDRGELGQSPFGVYYTACQAIIEIRLNFKPNRVHDSVSMKHFLREFERYVGRLPVLAGRNKAGVYAGGSDNIHESVRFVFTVNITDAYLKSVTDALNENIKALPKPLLDVLTDTPQVHISREALYQP